MTSLPSGFWWIPYRTATQCLVSVSYTHLDVYKRQIHNYLENAALRILLFGNPKLNFYQCRLLVLKYGESLSQDDLHGRMVFMLSLIHISAATENSIAKRTLNDVRLDIILHTSEMILSTNALAHPFMSVSYTHLQKKKTM